MSFPSRCDRNFYKFLSLISSIILEGHQGRLEEIGRWIFRERLQRSTFQANTSVNLLPLLNLPAATYLGIDVAIKEVLPSADYDVAKYFEREWRLMKSAIRIFSGDLAFTITLLERQDTLMSSSTLASLALPTQTAGFLSCRSLSKTVELSRPPLSTHMH